MRCAHYRHMTDLMLDGALKGESVVRLEAHLGSCASCRSYRDQGLRLKQLVSSTPRPDFPDWLHNRILHQCQSHEAQRSGYRKRAKFQLVPAAMAVMLSLVLGSLVGQNAYSVQVRNASQTTQSTYELSFGENTLVDSEYYSGGNNE